MGAPYGEIDETDLSIKYMKEVLKRAEKKSQNPIFLVRTYNNFAITSYYKDVAGIIIMFDSIEQYLVRPIMMKGLLNCHA